MRAAFWFGAFLVVFLVIAPVSGTEVRRVVLPRGENISEVRLTIANGTVLGITETLPAGSTVTACSLPPDQWRFSAGSLHLAVIGDTEISFTLQGRENRTLSGTWTDFSDGSKGNVLGEGESSPGAPQSPIPAAPATTRAVVPGILPVCSALCLGILTAYFRRH
jgi:hypothetical protein